MALDTNFVANTLQPKYNKELLRFYEEELKLDQFGKKASLPAKSGNKSVRFFREAERAPGNTVGLPQVLGEGIAPTQRGRISFDHIDVTLEQLGTVYDITDVADNVGLLNYFQQTTKTMGREMALDADNRIRNQLVKVATGFQRQYAQGLSNWSAVASATPQAARLTPNDLTDCMTQLKVNKTPKIKGGYVALVCPQVAGDILKSPEWTKVVRYDYAEKIFKGEIGEYNGIKIVEISNPWIENADLSEGVEAAANIERTKQIFSTIVLGDEAYGYVDMSMKNSSSPFKPSIIVCDKPDKTDPLNQLIVLGWKAFWASTVLNRKWGQVILSKSTFKYAPPATPTP
jgi:N4-gp56 family major capsid protein